MQVTQCSMGFLCVFRQVVLTDRYRLTNTHTALMVKVIADDNEKDDDDSLLELARSVVGILVAARGLVMVSKQRSADALIGARKHLALRSAAVVRLMTLITN